MNRLGPGEVRLRVHGLRTPLGHDRNVDGAVFGRKLTSLVKALQMADAAVNGAAAHTYELAGLSMGSAIAELREVVRPKWALLKPKQSGTAALGQCARAVATGDAGNARQFEGCPSALARLASGTNKQFGFGELWIEDQPPIRVDDFLAKQVRLVIDGVAEPVPTTHLFRGFADASFYGEVKAADLRGDLPQIKLVLAGAGREIDCICTADQKEQIRDVLDRRARIAGRAYYDGTQGVPLRLEVRSIEPVAPVTDFAKWRGAFKYAVPMAWPEPR